MANNSNESSNAVSSKDENGDNNCQENETSIDDLFASGKRHFFCNEYNEAVDMFQTVCHKLNEKFGDGADELANPLYFYGSALLELAKLENSVLENENMQAKSSVIQNGDGDQPSTSNDGPSTSVDPNHDDAHCEEVSNCNGEGNNVTDEGHKVEEEGPSCSNDPESKDDGDEENDEETEDAADESSNNEDETDDADGTTENETEEEPGSLQLAWETLEVSKRIYSCKPEEDREVQMKLADVCMKLGEVSMESESFDTAVEDFSKCLEIQKKFVEPDSRLLSAGLYHLGLTYALKQDFEKAIDHFDQSRQILENRLGRLKGLPEPDEKILTELKDLPDIIVDLSAKTKDTEYELENFAKLSTMVKEQCSRQLPSIPEEKDSTDAVPVHEVLVKRKQPTVSPVSPIEGKPATPKRKASSSAVEDGEKDTPSKKVKAK